MDATNERHEAGREREAGEAEPRFRASLAVSLDGYIADAAGEVGWLDAYFTPEIDFPAFVRTIGVTVMGRATWDWMVRHGHPVEAAARYVVQTHRPLEGAPPNVQAFAGDVRDLVGDLRRQLRGSGKDVWLMGGGESLAGFDEHGLIDRWELTIVPVLLGQGAPLFPQRDRRQVPLRLVRSRTLGNGMLQVEYEPERRGPVAHRSSRNG
jgi:dihydrofolate reductase